MNPFASNSPPADRAEATEAEGHRRPAAERRRSAGFTLVEVIAALVLTGALAVIVLPFMARTVERWVTGQRLVEDADLWMRVGARLTADLSAVVPLVIPAEGGPKLLFVANDHQIVFVRPALISTDGPGRLEVVRLTIEASPDGVSLVRRTAPFSSAIIDNDSHVEENATAILTGPYRLSFVLVALDGTRPSEWTSTKSLPRRIEMVASATATRPVPAAPIVLPITVRATSAATPAVPAGPANVQGVERLGDQPPPR